MESNASRLLNKGANEFVPIPDVMDAYGSGNRKKPGVIRPYADS
jgi:hypothetical protein